MWGKTKTFKIVYYDNSVMSGDKRRVTFYEAYDRSDAIISSSRITAVVW